MPHFKEAQNTRAGRHPGEYLSYPVVLRLYWVLRSFGAHAVHMYYRASTLRVYDSVGLMGKEGSGS